MTVVLRFSVPVVLAIAITVVSLSGVPSSAQAPETSDAEDLAAQMDRFPAVEPEEAIGTFAIQGGYTLELVASEPQVSDPVDACFDARGRMYVAEMHGYPYSEEVRKQQPEPLGKKDAGIIRLLEDTDADGRFDRSVVFADKLSWPTSVCCFDDGLFVLAPSQLMYLKDTDGDDVADVREVVFTGFPRDNVQGLANNMKWGLDNRITFAAGTNGGELMRNGEPVGSLRGRDVALNPWTKAVTFLTGGRQFGMGLDDWGNRFVCTNSNHIQHIVFEQADLAANPSVRVADAIRNIAAEGAAAPVFRKSPPEPWRIVRTRRRAADPNYRKRLPPTELVPVGFFTSATGVTIDRGNASPELNGLAFIGDVGGNLVHRKTLEPAGASFIATRVDEGVEFITSTDTWFRPVNFVNAPDGCLYILDMYRETIEHPASIPEDIKAHVDLESGHDRGRIWRLKPPGWTFTPPQPLAELTTDELVSQLESPNGWHRVTAQRLLVERHDDAAVKPLRTLAKSSSSALGHLHAVCTLAGLNALSVPDLLVLLTDEEPRNRTAGLQLWRRSAGDLKTTAELLTAMTGLVEDPDIRCRFELALSLPTLDENARKTIWQMLAASDAIPADLRTALVLAATSQRDELLESLILAESTPSADQRALILDLVERIGSDKDSAEAVRLLERVVGAGPQAVLNGRVVTRLADGLRSQSSSLSDLMASLSRDSQNNLQRAFALAAETARDPNKSVAGRETAIALLAHADFAQAGPVLADLLSPQTSQRLQLAAVNALRLHPARPTGELLLGKLWPTLTPAVRVEAVDVLLSQTERTQLLLAAMAAGTVRPGDLEAADRDLLLNHPTKAIREQATQVLGQPTSADRAAVIAEYTPALADEPDLKNGKAVFKKVCFACHQLGDEGHVVGPELASVANKSPEDLLIALLDPNREAQPRYASYTILTTDGRVVTGLIAAESAENVTLRRAEGKEDTVRREDIEVMKANGVSLMPAGLEKDLSPRQVADVIALVRSLTASAAAKESRPGGSSK